MFFDFCFNSYLYFIKFYLFHTNSFKIEFRHLKINIFTIHLINVFMLDISSSWHSNTITFPAIWEPLYYCCRCSCYRLPKVICNFISLIIFSLNLYKLLLLFNTKVVVLILLLLLLCIKILVDVILVEHIFFLVFSVVVVGCYCCCSNHT